MNRRISIAMTTYNGEKYLSEQLDSIYSQTLLPDEVIVVDDCSRDKTIEILENYHQIHGLIYYQNKTNLGVNRNFEKAIRACSGDYVALSDQDDVWFPSKLETSFRKLLSIEENGPALVSSNVFKVDAQLRIIDKRKKNARDSDSYVTTLLGHHSQGCTLIFNRSLLKYVLPIPYDEGILFDLYIGLTAAMIGKKYNIGEPLMFYRQHDTNVRLTYNSVGTSLIQRIDNIFKNRYPRLVSEGRLYIMRIVAERQSDNFCEERAKLYNKLLYLENDLTLQQKLGLIFSLREIPWSNRMIAVLTSLISHIYRKIIVK